MEAWFHREGITDQVQQAEWLYDGLALKLWPDTRHLAGLSYGDLKERLRKLFGVPIAQIQSVAELATLKQKGGETTSAFLARVRTLVHQAKPNLTPAQYEEAVVERFVPWTTDDDLQGWAPPEGSGGRSHDIPSVQTDLHPGGQKGPAKPGSKRDQREGRRCQVGQG